MTSPLIPLGSGLAMPQVGLGVFDIPPDRIDAALSAAIETGYRSFDTAANYGNESDVGRAVATSGLPRSDFFVTTKLWNQHQGYESTLRAFDRSLTELRLEYLDLYLIHWPMPRRDDFVDTWRAFIWLRDQGAVRSIGVSNFREHHLNRVITETGVVPAVNQIELHPYLQQRSVVDYDHSLGIVTAAWSPFAVGAVLTDPVIEHVAVVHGITAAQVVMRWHVQHGRVVLPRSSDPSRIASNFNCFAFVLDPEDMAAIDALDRNGRVGADPEEVN
jgi:diketogulonate reductase-like aldo/keto reductase